MLWRRFGVRAKEGSASRTDLRQCRKKAARTASVYSREYTKWNETSWRLVFVECAWYCFGWVTCVTEAAKKQIPGAGERALSLVICGLENVVGVDWIVSSAVCVWYAAANKLFYMKIHQAKNTWVNKILMITFIPILLFGWAVCVVRVFGAHVPCHGLQSQRSDLIFVPSIAPRIPPTFI